MFLLNNKNLILEESNLKLSNLVSFAALVSQGKERLFFTAEGMTSWTKQKFLLRI